MGDQIDKKSKKLGYWKEAMGLQQQHHLRPKKDEQSHFHKKQKFLLDGHEDEFVVSKSKRITPRPSAKLLSLIFLSFLCFFIILSPYCFPAVDSSSSLAGIEFDPPISSSPPPEDSVDYITGNTDADAPLSSSTLNYSFDSYPMIDTNSSVPLPSFALNDSSDSPLDKNSSAPMPSSTSITRSLEFPTDKNSSAPQPSSARNALPFESHNDTNSSSPLPFPARNETIWCDRSGFRSDICFMRGDIRTQSTTSSVILYTSSNTTTTAAAAAGGGDKEPNTTQHEKIRPYTRKWETSVMNTIDELHLISTPKENHQPLLHCDVTYDVPAVFFSTGGYTGNVYHEFNDGLIPLYITSHHFNKRVVFFILEYHTWWISKYADILSEMSDYPAVDFSGDNRTHYCFPEAIVGLRIHDELTIEPALLQGTKESCLISALIILILIRKLL
ncbi:unnamed protein product [Linum trigynum]|uniref:Uncharacterized protein n=1 Tax=Linum trigynum TaxID=586398 RepID=A0AAV2C8Z6_9ROSI